MHPLVKKESQIIYDNKNIVHFETLGCRLNQIESESAANFFFEEGFRVSMVNITSHDSENNDVIMCVVNTCTVTGKAEQKCRRTIRLLLKKFPFAVVLVTGCYAQTAVKEISLIDSRIAVLPGRIKSRLSQIPKIVKSFYGAKNIDKENIDKNFVLEKVLSKENATSLAELLRNGVCSGTVPKISENAFLLSTETFFAHSRSAIKIQDGCSHKCTYCGICIARGDSVSLPVNEVVSRVKKMQESGQKEVVFTTVNIGQYRGEYNGHHVDFITLLEILLNETKDISLRFSSLYPEVINEKFCALARNSRVQPHFHISVQSGSDKILKAMNRPYEARQVLEAVEMLKTAKENPFLACDIIAGFPGETDEDFNETLDLCKQCGFTWIHAFPFSPRPGTVAYSMTPKVKEAVAGQRVKQLLDFACKSKISYVESLCGTVHKAVTETIRNNTITAVTDNFIHVEIERSKLEKIPAPGSLVNIEIKKTLFESILKGEEREALGIIKYF